MINFYDTIKLFGDEITKSYIFHIPHSSLLIPEDNNFIFNKIDSENELFSDHATDQIFDLPNTSKLIFPYSRIFCDVERLNDELETMYKFGRGFYYTNTDSGERLRFNDNTYKKYIYDNFYIPHHQKLIHLVNEKINEVGFATIIDCHSFPDTPFETDLDKTTERPDICLGVDNFHTPQDWLIEIKDMFEKAGFSVKINSPYSGTIIPLEFLKNDKVISVMIEINRKLYMKDGVVVNHLVNRLNTLIKHIFLF